QLGGETRCVRSVDRPAPLSNGGANNLMRRAAGVREKRAERRGGARTTPRKERKIYPRGGGRPLLWGRNPPPAKRGRGRGGRVRCCFVSEHVILWENSPPSFGRVRHASEEGPPPHPEDPTRGCGGPMNAGCATKLT